LLEREVGVDIEWLKGCREVMGQVEQFDVALPACFVELYRMVEVATVKDQEPSILSTSSSSSGVGAKVVHKPPPSYVPGRVFLRVTVAVRFGVSSCTATHSSKRFLPRVEQKQRDRSIRHTYCKDCGDMNVIGQQGLRLD